MNHYYVNRCGQSVLVEDSTQEGLPALFASIFTCFDFELEGKENSPEKVFVTSTDSGWQIQESSSNYLKDVSNVGDLSYFLSDRIIFNLINKMNSGHCIHAACVVKKEKAIILPAQSGAGKSSLTCWLIANGFDYVTDELVILTDDARVQAIPRPVQIKKHGVDVVASLLSVEGGQQALTGNTATSYAPSAFHSEFSGSKIFDLALILCPQYDAQSKYAFAEMSSAQGAASLMASYVNARSMKRHGFKFMAQLARETPVFSLEYGGYPYLKSSFKQELSLLV